MMKKNNLFFTGILSMILMIFLITEKCIGGAVVEQVRREVDGRSSKIILYFSGYKYRTDHPEERSSVIIDFKGDRMVMIDHRSKNYLEIKFSQWEKKVAENLKRSIPKIKPKQRKINIVRTGEKALINGFNTEKVEIHADGELIEENWVTKDVDLEEVEQVMEKVAMSFSKYFSLEMKEGREIYEKLKPYGIPILIKDHSLTYGLGGINVLEVIKLEKKELEEEVFMPPGDYKKVIVENTEK